MKDYIGEELNVYLIGVLADEHELKKMNPTLSPVKSNQFNSFQFFLDILNPEDFNIPDNKIGKKKFFSGYEDIIRDNKWEKIAEETKFFRENAFEEFAQNKLFIFKPYIDTNNYGELIYKIAKNSLTIIEKPKEITNKSELITIPIFKDYNTFSFEKRLLNEQSVGNLEMLDYSTLPSSIIHGNFIYGDFSNSERLNDGWHFSYDEPIKKIALDFEEYKEFIVKRSNAIYMESSFFFEIILNSIKEQGILVTEVSSLKTLSLNDEMIHEETNTINESEFMDYLYRNLQNNKFVFEKSQIINFHTALKTKRLVMLSGASGTGKSRLVYNYAKSLGIINKDYNQFKMIPVKPNWKDDTDLIGFLDTINNIYRPSESGLIDTLLEASKNRDKLYLICFDEMNLAKIEHYFAQFLSVMEMDANERKITLYNKKLIGRVLNGEQYPYEITIHPNVLFVGTINIDESTYSLSDKVLDRTNLIEFNVPSNHIKNWIIQFESKAADKKNTENNKKKTISFSDFNDWTQHQETNSSLTEEEILFLENLHNIIVSIDNTKGIGFRILDHILSYMINLPRDSYLSRENAFDLQIAQKILPKIRGTAEELSVILETDENKNYKFLELFKNNQVISDFKISISSVERKLKELQLYGYTYQ